MNPGRNDPCPCGSGKKYKHCCLSAKHTPEQFAWRRLRQELDQFSPRMAQFFFERYGEEAFHEAWSQFTDSDEAAAFDPESPHLPVFRAWLMHRWAPHAASLEITDPALYGLCPSRAWLEHEGRRASPLLREYLASCQEQAFRFYAVLESEPGQGLRLEDLSTGETLDVSERQASQGLRAGELIFAQIARPGQLCLIEACAPYPLPPADRLEVIALRKEMLESGVPLDAAEPCEWEEALIGLYRRLLDRMLLQPTLQLATTDGDPLELHKLVFDIDSVEEAFDALKSLDIVHSEAELLADAKRGSDGRLQRVELTWSEPGNAMYTYWDNTVLGHLRIQGNRLSAEVNSRARAERLREIVERRLGPRARLRADRVQSADRMLREAKSQPAMEAAPDMDAEQFQALVAEMLERHYLNWLDVAVPALGGRSPRQAVAQGDREQVEALLRDIELRGLQLPEAEAADLLRRMRESLGL